MYGYEAIADAIIRENVDTVFAVVGEDTMLLGAELRQRGVRVVCCRRESGAAGMADGYSRVTGKPCVCVVTLGPGLANAAAALTTAKRHGSPVICITTEPPIFAPANKVFDQHPFAETTAGTHMVAHHSDALAARIQAAFHHVRSGAGPVVLTVATEIMNGHVADWEYADAVSAFPPRQKIHPDPAMIAKAVDFLRTAERPAIVLGRGAFEAGAGEEATALAERMGALVSTTLLGKGCLADHPYNVGITGIFGTDTGRALLCESDLVIAVGCSLNQYTTEFGLLFMEAQIVHIDHNASQLGKSTPVALGILGDGHSTLAALNRELATQGFAAKQGFWTEEVRSRIAASRTAQPSWVALRDTIDPREFAAGIEKVLPKDRIVAIDGGHFFMFVAGAVSVPDPSCLLWTLDFGCIGMSLYQGVGAAIGQPNKHVVVFAGDGGFMQSLEELDTAVRERIPMTVIVMNDNGFGAEVHFLEEFGKPTDIAAYDNPDFAALARAFGAVGLTVSNAEDIGAVGRVVGTADRPVLIDVKVNPSVVSEFWPVLAARKRPSELETGEAVFARAKRS